MIIRDITQRRQAESSVKAAAEALQRSRDFFQNVFDVAGDGLYVTDDMGNIVFANRALYTMLGYEPGELIGMSGTAFSVSMDTVSVGSDEEQHWYTRDYTTPMETCIVVKTVLICLLRPGLIIYPRGAGSGMGLSSCCVISLSASGQNPA